MSEDPDPYLSSVATFLIISLIILLLLSAFFSATETAFTSLNKIKIEHAAKKNKSARLVNKYIKHFDKILSTVLIGNNAVNIAASAIVTVLCVNYFKDIGVTIGTVILTIVVLIFGEVSPKTLAKEHAETIAKINIYPFLFFYYLFYPLSYLLSLFQKLIVKITAKKKNKPIYTEEEFLIVANKMNNQKVINDIENDLIKNTLIYADTKVKDVLVKKKNVAYIADKDSMEDISKKYVECNFSRLVVTKNHNLSTAYGFLHQKDFFECLYKKEDIKKYIIANPIICKPNHKISRLLKKMQTRHQHIALVKNNNTLVGIVTMEDIIEKLLGSIQDENN